MIRLSRDLYDEVIEHCRKESPKEACGMFGGSGDRVAQVYLMKNVDASPVSYQMDPKEQLLVAKRMREAGEGLLAIFHSHTATDAYPSPVDVSLAVYEDVQYVLVSLKDPDAPVMRTFDIRGGVITEGELRVE